MYRAFEMGDMDFKFIDAGIGILLAHIGELLWMSDGNLFYPPPCGRSKGRPYHNLPGLVNRPVSELSVLVILGVIIALILIYAVRLRVVPVPCGRKARNEIISYLPREACRVTDFGSGWGDLVISIARARPDITVTGIELSPLPYAVSRIRARINQLENLFLIRADFRKIDRDPGDVVVCFLDPRVMADVGDVLNQRMAPGGIVISRAFAIPGWQAFGEIPMQSGSDMLYLYRIGSHLPG